MVRMSKSAHSPRMEKTSLASSVSGWAFDSTARSCWLEPTLLAGFFSHQNHDPDRVLAYLGIRALRDTDADVVGMVVADELLAVERVHVGDRRDHAADARVHVAERIELMARDRPQRIARLARREPVGELLRRARQLRGHRDRLDRFDPLLDELGRDVDIDLRRDPDEHLRDEQLA